MAEVIKTTFQFRRGKSTTWASINPVLAAGEPGWEKDTNRLKIGDGETPWNDLKYFLGDFTISSDNSSLSVASNATLQLYGFEQASEGQIPRKKNSKLEWIDSTDAFTEALTEEELLNILV